MWTKATDAIVLQNLPLLSTVWRIMQENIPSYFNWLWAELGIQAALNAFVKIMESVLSYHLFWESNSVKYWEQNSKNNQSLSKTKCSWICMQPDFQAKDAGFH